MATQRDQGLGGSPLPLVSVILPILNEEPYLRDAVLSILSQDYQGNFEVVLAVGPSKDRTHEIADQLHQEDSRVMVVDNPSGRTAAGRKSRGGGCWQGSCPPILRPCVGASRACKPLPH